MQQGDVILYQTPDGGEINIDRGLVEMSGGLETAAYLSLFGGNEDDDGRELNPFNWWGNIAETQTDRQYRSETQNLVEALPATSNNLNRIQDAATRDLEWFIESRIASSVTVVATIPAVNTVKVVVTIEANGLESRFEFVENWKATK